MNKEEITKRAKKLIRDCTYDNGRWRKENPAYFCRIQADRWRRGDWGEPNEHSAQEWDWTAEVVLDLLRQASA
jgi:hypothetical protein